MAIKKYLFDFKHVYLASFICMIVAIVLDMVYPLITQKIIDSVIVNENNKLLSGLLAVLLLISVGRALMEFTKEYLVNYSSSVIASNYRKDLFSHIQTLPVDYFRRTKVGEIITRVKDDVDNVRMAIGYLGMVMIQVIIHVIIVLLCMFRLNWKLAIIPVITMLISGVITILIENKMNSVYGRISEANAELNSNVSENILGIRTIKIFGGEENEFKKFSEFNEDYYEQNLEQSQISAKYSPYFQFIGRILSVIVVIMGGASVIDGKMTIGSLVAFIEYCRNIFWPMEMLGWLTNGISSALASQEKLDSIFKQKASERQKEKLTAQSQTNGDIEFKNVSFSIKGKPILENVSFKIKKGRSLGIMGTVNSGKTSIVNLLLGFYEYDEGDILFNNISIAKIPKEELRNNIALVMQDVFLFSETIESNISLGQKEQLHFSDIKAAAISAAAHNFIDVLKYKYKTVIGERGVGLSGGQKQRISIARALSKNKPILIMDDAMSSLDRVTANKVKTAIAKLKCTKIIISNSIFEVRDADEIIYLDHGMIKERGNHNSLLQQNGIYAEIYLNQYGGDE